MSLIPTDESTNRGRGEGDDTATDSSRSFVGWSLTRALSWLAGGLRSARRLIAARQNRPAKTVIERRRRERFESDDSPRRVVTTLDTRDANDGQRADIRVETRGSGLFTKPPSEDDDEDNRPLAVGEIDGGELTVREPGARETAITSDVWERVDP